MKNNSFLSDLSMCIGLGGLVTGLLYLYVLKEDKKDKSVKKTILNNKNGKDKK